MVDKGETMEPQMEQNQPNATVQETRGGCLPVAVPIVAALWIVITSLIAQLTSYSIEQTLFNNEISVPDARWEVALIYSLALLLPLGLGMAILKPSRSRVILRTWLAAALFSLLFVPVRLVWLTDAQVTAFLQMIVLLVYLLGLLAWRRRLSQPSQSTQTGHLIWLAVFFALLLAVPWVLWGALGSVLDTLLGLSVGLLLGFNAALLLDTSLMAEPGDLAQRAGSDGLVFALALVVMATGLGQNNQQWLLAITLPVLAWVGVYFILAGRRLGARGWLPAALLLGLAAAWVLVWVDPDELALVTNGGNPAEIAGWTTTMTRIMLAIGLVVSLLAGVILTRVKGTRWLWLAVAGTVSGVLILGGLYAFLGQPGFYGEHLFVILRQQADLSNTERMPDYTQRREWVYQTLTRHASDSQTGLRNRLDQAGIQYQPYYLVNALEVRGGLFLKLWLQAQPEVDRVLANPMMRPLPEPVPADSGSYPAPEQVQWNLTSIGADQVWRDLDVDGTGVIVGQSDSGVQGDHPELADSYLGRDGQNDYRWYDPWNGTSQPTDIGGHGTHTLGSILGNRVGVAPGASWIGCVNLARNLGNPAYYLDCMQFMLAPFPQSGDPFTDGDPSRGAMVLNNSWGCPGVEGCDPNSLLPAVRALRAAGVFVVVSAGNSGDAGCGSVMDPPAIYQEVYSVGAVDEGGEIAPFSSRGPVSVDGSDRIKPDIAAPGVQVLSSYPGSTYYYASGTSMAGPHVVGVVALMWSANPGLIGDIDRTTQILNETARPFRGPINGCGASGSEKNNLVGYGLLDAYAAVKMAMEQSQ